MAGDAAGNFVVVWTSAGNAGMETGLSFGIQGQRYDSSGVAVGGEFQVNTYTTSNQRRPAVASDEAGAFVVAWESYGSAGTDTDDLSIHGRRYDSSGVAVGGEFQVNTYTTDDQWRAAVAVEDAGDFAVVWVSRGSTGTDTDFFSIQGQRYDSSGMAVGGEFQVNTYTTDRQSYPAATGDGAGGFVVTWTFQWTIAGSVTVQGQRYDASGTPMGGEFQANTYGMSAGVSRSAVADDGAGGFVVVWDSDVSGGTDHSSSSIQGQRYSSVTMTTTTTTTTLPSAGCPLSPLGGCLTGLKALFQVKDNADDTKDQLKWKLNRGDGVTQGDLGNPDTTATYTLCIYDSTASVDQLVGTVQIDPGVTWESKDPKGWKYKDKTGTEDGVQKAQLKTGDAGRSKAQVKAKGLNLPLPPPISGTEFFDQDPRVTVQLINDETPTCWTSELTTAKKNTAEQFKAKAP